MELFSIAKKIIELGTYYLVPTVDYGIYILYIMNEVITINLTLYDIQSLVRAEIPLLKMWVLQK